MTAARWRSVALAGSVALACVGSASAGAEDQLAGPVSARLVSVVDGDTLRVEARVWLGLTVAVDVRIRGIDAPEIRGRCPREKLMAAKATERLRQAVVRPVLSLSNVGEDKYFGRVVADVTNAAGADVASAMLASGLVRPYDGGGRGEWCDLAAVDGG